MTESKKFKSPVAFESYDQGKAYEPTQLPDLKPYLDANKAVEQKDLQQGLEIGLKHMELEYERDSATIAYNQAIDNYISQNRLDNVKHISKSIQNIVTQGIQIKDQIDQRNAMNFFQEEYMNGNIARLNDQVRWNSNLQKLEFIDGEIKTTAGAFHQTGELDNDNIHKLLNLSHWQGPYRQQLLLKHYAEQIPAFYANNSSVELEIPESLGGIPGKKYSIALNNFEKGVSGPQRAWFEKQIDTKLFNMLSDAGFKPEAVATYITPEVIKYHKDSEVDFSDENNTEIEAMYINDAKTSLIAAKQDKSGPDAFANGIVKTINNLQKWTGDRSGSTEMVFQQLKKLAESNDVNESQLTKLYDQKFTPIGHKKPVRFGDFFANKLDEHDPIEAWEDGLKERVTQAKDTREALIDQGVNEAADLVKQYGEENNGAPPPKELLWQIINKTNKATGEQTYSHFSSILNAENVDEPQRKEYFKWLYTEQGGRLNDSDLRGESNSIRFWARSQGLWKPGSSGVTKETADAAKVSITRIMNGYLPGEKGEFDKGEKWDTVERLSNKDYLSIVNGFMDNGMPEGDADQKARELVRKRMYDGHYDFEPDIPKDVNTNYKMGLKELSTNKGDVSIPIKVLKSDLEKSYKRIKEGDGMIDIPSLVKQLAKESGYSNYQFFKKQMEALFGPGALVDPRQERQAGGFRDTKLSTTYPSNNRALRSIEENGSEYEQSIRSDEAVEGYNGYRLSNGTLVPFKWEEEFGRPLEEFTISEVLTILNKGKAKTASPYNFTQQELITILDTSGIDSETMMTEDTLRNLLYYKLSPNLGVMVPVEEVSFYNQPFLLYEGLAT